MKKKIILIKGSANLLPHITSAEFERINADHLVLIAALRYPQFMPSDLTVDADIILKEYKEIMTHWHQIDQDYFLISEYASTVIDRGRVNIKAVEGNSLRVPWFYESIKNIHKQFGQMIIDVDIIKIKDQIIIKIDHEELTWNEAVEHLKPDYLG